MCTPPRAKLPKERRIFNMGLCPCCASGRIWVTHTIKPRRRLACKICGHRWETLELLVSEPGWLEGALGYLLSEGRLAEYLDVLPYLSAIIARSIK
jgi:hypothetical protein